MHWLKESKRIIQQREIIVIVFDKESIDLRAIKHLHGQSYQSMYIMLIIVVLTIHICSRIWGCRELSVRQCGSWGHENPVSIAWVCWIKGYSGTNIHVAFIWDCIHKNHLQRMTRTAQEGASGGGLVEDASPTVLAFFATRPGDFGFLFSRRDSNTAINSSSSRKWHV